MIGRTVTALLLAVGLAAAADAPGLDAPLKNPTARRLRTKANTLWESANAVYTRAKATDEKIPVPSTEELRKAQADIVEAIELFEKAQVHEWDLSTNALQAQAVRAWADLNANLPPVEPPKDPEKLAKWNAAREKQASRRKRDARRQLGKLLSNRRHSKLFQRCPRCDGRGEIKDRFGGQPGQKSTTRTCRTCDGNKLIAHRKRIVNAYWLCYSPNFRSDGRNRSDMNYVLRLGVRGENKLAPYTISTRIAPKFEDHGWWLKVTVEEKIHDEPSDRKGTERVSEYVLMHIGKIWWLHSARFDSGGLLQLPEPEPEEVQKKPSDSDRAG